MEISGVFYVLAAIIMFMLMGLALRWRRIALDYRAICKDHQHTIFMQERELLDLRIYKRNLEHRAAKRAML